MACTLVGQARACPRVDARQRRPPLHERSNGLTLLLRRSTRQRSCGRDRSSRDPDYEPDGSWYSLVFTGGRLYATEPNHGLLVSVQPDRATWNW
jgi:hypothetical protein